MGDQAEYPGRCPICEQDVVFRRTGQAWRTLECPGCRSASRNRALWVALNGAYPRWRELAVHESSPGWDVVSRKLARECGRYTASQYRDDLPAGTLVTETSLPCGRYQVENLERQSFADETFDLVVSQDVFEHVFDPLAAIAEIARTLRPGGATLMTVPVVRKFRPSQRRARLANGAVEHLLPAQFHGNPVSEEGALVTIDWGYDIASHLAAASGLHVVMQTFEQPELGIRDECNQVLIGYKGKLASIA